jgi:hypothetical protein
VARSLDVDMQSAPERARAAFAWVGRQVYDRPWTLSDQRGGMFALPTVPPQFILKRAYGTHVDRESVFLALARQMDLDAVLIGPPGLEKSRRQPLNTPRARGIFWAVGVATGGDLLLYDPWLAVPMTAADGKSILKFSEVRKAPKLIEDWFTASKSTDPPKADAVANSICYAAAPVTAATPRMKLLEDKLAAAGLSARLAVDVAIRSTAGANLPGGLAWHAPSIEVDPYAIAHGLGSFLPRAEGGYDEKPQGPEQLAFQLTLEPFIGAGFTPPAELTNDRAKREFHSRCVSVYKQILFDNDVRDKVQRGLLNDAVKQLHDLERGFAGQRERGRDPAMMKAVQEWAAQANKAYSDLALAALPEHADKRTAAEMEVDSVWKNSTVAALAVQTAVTATAAVESGYWMALAKHEQAARSTTRYRRAVEAAKESQRTKAVSDWAIAKDEWTRFQDQSATRDAAHPGRNAHAAAMLALANRMMINLDAE